MQQLLVSGWFKRTACFTAAAVLLSFVPFSPLAMAGGVALVVLVPGVQLTRWLGLYQPQSPFRTVALSVALGLVTAPILTYWSSLLLGFNRAWLTIIFCLYSLVLAGWLGYKERERPYQKIDDLKTGTTGLWLMAAVLMGVTILGVFLAYFEIETGHGFYPVQMEDWQKHYGVAFALRYTGIPPTSMFFYGMFPHEQLVYYYFLHLNAATLDLLQSGGPFLHNAFVVVIILAALSFSSIFFILAWTLFDSQKMAVWSLAFATVIGGLDIVPTLHRAVQQYRAHFPTGPLPAGVFIPREHIDNWVSALSLRLNTFYAYYIWVPQHLTGLTIVCLGCFLYLKVQERRKLLVMLPLLLFALLGHSTWIALVVSISLFLFASRQIYLIYRWQGLAAARKLFFAYTVIALAFVVVALPFILSLTGPQAPKSGVAFEIPTLDSWSILRPFQATFGPAVWARLLDLPLHFFIEMGALLVAGLAGLVLFWREAIPARGTNQTDPARNNGWLPAGNELHARLPASRTLLPFWVLLLALGTVTVTSFASGRGWAELGLVQNNDLGLRALMPGQLVLALFAGYFVVRLLASSGARWWKSVQVMGLGGLIILGLAYAGWEFTAMGLAKYWREPQLSSDVYQVLRALPEVTHAPQGKLLPVVQHRLHRDAARFQLSLGGRPVGFSTGEAVVFHRDVHDLALALELSQQAFDNGLPVWSYQMFQNLGADYLFVGPAEREAMRHPEKYQHPQYFKQVYRQGDFEIYQVLPPAYSPGQAQADFDEQAIAFEGYFIDRAPFYPGEQVSSATVLDLDKAPGIVTAWRLSRPAAKDYTVFIHLVDGSGNIIAQADHQLWAWDVTDEGPTSSWTPGLTHLDIIPVPAAALAAGQPLTIRLGLWLPKTGQQFPAATSTLTMDASGRLVVGQWPP